MVFNALARRDISNFVTAFLQAEPQRPLLEHIVSGCGRQATATHPFRC